MRKRSRFLSIFKLGGAAAALSLISQSANAFAFNAVPEPSTLALLAGGIAAAIIVSRLRGRK